MTQTRRCLYSRVGPSVHVRHLCWHRSQLLPVWQPVIDWLLNAPFTPLYAQKQESPLCIYQWVSPNPNEGQMQAAAESRFLTPTESKFTETPSASDTHTEKDVNTRPFCSICLVISHMHVFLSVSNYTLTYTHFSIHLKCLAIVDNNDQKSPWEELVRRWAVFFTKTTHYSAPCLLEWPQCACV